MPAVIAVTAPVDAPMTATEALELFHEPPEDPLFVYWADVPSQIDELPLMIPAVRLGFTDKI